MLVQYTVSLTSGDCCSRAWKEEGPCRRTGWALLGYLPAHFCFTCGISHLIAAACLPLPSRPRLLHCDSPVGHTGKVKEQRGEAQRQLQAVTHVFRKQAPDWSKRLVGCTIGPPVSPF